MTKNLDDEIMGWKEEMRAEGIPEEDITRAVEEATKTYQAEGRPPDLEAIAERAPEEVSQPPTELSSRPT